MRNVTLRMTGVVLPLVLVLLVIACSDVSANDDAMFRAGPRHTGVYQQPAITHFSGIKWKFHTGGLVISSPAIAQGILYVGSTDGKLYALDAPSGKLRWKYGTGARVTSSPAVANGIVYFGSYDSYFYALDALDGKLKWKFKTGGEHRFEGTHLHGMQPSAELMPDPFDIYLSSPVVWDRTVFFGSGDGNIYALNASTGSLKWRFKTGDVVHASPAIDRGTLFIGSWDSYFYALDAATGKERWRFKTGIDPAIHNQIGIQSSAAVENGLVYFGCRDSHLYALDEKTGRKRWAIPTHGSWVIGSPAIASGKVYFATSDSGLFYSVDATTGHVNFVLDFHQWPMFSSPAVDAGMVYIGSDMGKLLAIDASRGRLAWSFAAPAEKYFGPRYTNRDGTPNYYAMTPSFFYDDVVTGYQKLLAIGSILASPVIADGVVYAGSSDGNLYALI